METPSASAFATPATVASFAGQDHTVAVQGDLHETAAHTATSVSGKTTSIFTHDGGIQAFAGNGPVSIRAHTDAMEIYAEQDVTVVSVNDEIRIHAKNKIEMIGGQSKVTLEGGNVTYACPGNFTVKSSGHQWEGPGNGTVELPRLPRGNATPIPANNPLFAVYDEQVVFKDSTGEPISGRLRYEVVNQADPDQFVAGNTPVLGEVERMETPSAQPLEQRLRFAKFKFDL